VSRARARIRTKDGGSTRPPVFVPDSRMLCTRPMGASLELWTDLYARTARVVVVVLVLYRGALV